MKLWQYIVIAGLGAIFLIRETAYTPKEFVKKMIPIANKIYEKYGIRQEYLITHSSHESNYGNSLLTRKANNLFGWKWDKKRNYIEMLTKEVENGKEIKVLARFNKYNSWTESAMDYAEKISTIPLYRGVYNQSKIGTVNNWAWALGVSGYATDPEYANKLIARYNALKKYFDAV